MYAYFKGIIEEINLNETVLEVNGIGYNIQMPMVKALELGNTGDEVKIYTYTNVKEDTFSLFGFGTKEELELFKLLISVSGVGPKSAQGLLNSFDVTELQFAIHNGNVSLISKAQGIGRKTAERIIIDLKDKVSASEGSDAATDIVHVNVDNDAKSETIEALMTLGYSKKESEKAIEKAAAAGALSSEELLRGALRNL